MENFKYFALLYLNDWCAADRGFVEDLSPSESKGDRLRCLQRAVAYYRIARNFKTIDEPERLGTALAALDAVANSIAEENVDSVVCRLAEEFQTAYGKYAISAASKLLWIRHQSPVVIYDSQAINYLKSRGAKLHEGHYHPYRQEWLRQFAKREEAIRSACAELVDVKRFSIAAALPDDEVRAIGGNRWFRERVFDKCLWSSGLD